MLAILGCLKLVELNDEAAGRVVRKDNFRLVGVNVEEL